MEPAVASLHLHPVKSCRGFEVPTADLDAYGLVGDRRWMIVDDRGVFLTQRTQPRLALLRASIEGPALALETEGVGRIVVPPPGPRAAPREVTVWKDTVRALDLGESVAAWLEAFLGRPARLVTAAPDYARPVRRAARSGDEVSFADGFPLLVVAEASLADLNRRLEVPVPTDRFRPNLVVTGCEAFAEDRWRRIRIGDCVLRAAGPCGRCIVTTTDQATAERGREPLRTLATYRRDGDGEVCFGQNYVNESKSGRLDRGGRITVLE